MRMEDTHQQARCLALSAECYLAGQSHRLSGEGYLAGQCHQQAGGVLVAAEALEAGQCCLPAAPPGAGSPGAGPFEAAPVPRPRARPAAGPS